MVSMDVDGPTIIYPPPEVRNIVDKTASFVARNGVEFEQRIKQNEINNPKFNFLNSGDPYHAYYQYKVDLIREGKQEPEKIKAPEVAPATAVATKQSDFLKSVTKEKDIIPKEPPAEFEFIADPPSISAFDLDVVKLTAQFVARNGRQFLTQLMNREQRNFQFDFLRPQHSLFQYFTKLLEQYTKVLIPPKDLQDKLDMDKESVMEQVRYRVAWLKQQEANRRRQEEALEKERVSYAQVDWHNFVVVETVDYQPWEVGNFPPPTNPSEVGARVLIQRRQEEHGTAVPQPSYNDSDESDEERDAGADTNVQDMDEDSSDDEGEGAPRRVPQQVMAAPPVQQPMAPPIQAPVPGNVTVRKYDPKAAAAIKKKTDDDQFLISPITGEKIPASRAAEHMKVGLLDPRWVEERDKQISSKQSEEVVYAPGQSIESSLKQYAERRSDIFGVGDEGETMIGKKIGEEETRPDPKMAWDGHGSTADSAAKAARIGVTVEDQIAQIHRQKGLMTGEPEPPMPVSKPVVMAHAAPAPPMMVPPVAPMIVGVPMRPAMVVPAQVFAPPAMPAAPPIYMPPMPMMDEDEPASKKSRIEEHLIPEGEFLARNAGPVTFKVSVPSMADKPEWKCDGQMMSVTLALTETVNSVKSKIMEEIGMPQGKQKLQHETLFLKDANSLAYYNIMPGAVLNLQLKERGGRKK